MAIYKLGDLIKINNYKNDNALVIDWFIDASNISELNYYKYEKQLCTISPKNSIIFVKDGSVGKFNYVYKNIAIGTTLFSFDVKNLNCLIKFLFFWIKKNKNEILKFKKGSVIQHIYFSDLIKLEINLPSLEEQQKIIDIIESKENLFIKYSNLVRIDKFENTKKDIDNLIDIIEPLEKFEVLINKINQKFSEFIKNLPTSKQYFYLNSCAELKNNNPKGIQQLSAKVLQKRNILINNFEKKIHI